MEISTGFVGSLFARYRTNDDLLSYLQTFMSKLGLDVTNLLNLGMKGQNLNLCFQRRLITHISN